MVSKTEREQSQLNCLELSSVLDAIFDTGKTTVFMKICQVSYVFNDSVDSLSSEIVNVEVKTEQRRVQSNTVSPLLYKTDSVLYP